MDEERLKRTLERLEARLQRLERLAGVEPEPREGPAPPRAPQAPETRPRDDEPRRGPPPTAPPRPAAPPTAPQPAAPPRQAPPTAPQPAAPPRTVPPKAPPSGAVERPARPRAPLELRIGQNWFAWVGAIVIVIGVGFLVMYGVEQGWWGALPAAARCLLVAAFGAVLLVAGEAALRRIGPAAAAGLFGAGLGTLYLDAFAAFEWFSPPLVSREGAFVLMGAVALGGFGVTLHTRFLAIGVLSLVGGYLTPLLLAGGGGHEAEVGSYLTVLLAIGLGLSAARPESFRPLRYVTMGGLGLVGALWVLAAAGAAWLAGLLFIAVWWAAVLAETVVAALRDQSRVGNVVASLLATAWFVTAGCWLLAGTQPPGFDWLGTFTLLVGVAAGVTAAHFGPPPAALAGRPAGAMHALAVALWAEAAVLLVVAVALQFDGFGQSIGWLAVALAAVEIGRRLRLRAASVFGLVVGGLALLRVALLDRALPALQPTVLAFGGVTVTRWTVLALGAIAAVLATSWRLRPARHVAPALLALLAAAGWLALCRLQAEGLWTTGGWLLGAVALLAVERSGRRHRFLEIGLLILAAAAVRWLVVDAAARRLDPAWDATAVTPLLNGQMALAAAIALVGWWASRLLARRAADRPGLSAAWQLAVAAGAVLALVGFSFEIDRVVEAMMAHGAPAGLPWSQARQLLLTMLWAAGSVGLGVAARAFVARGARREAALPGGTALLGRFAWTLLGLCAVKWLLGDTLYWSLSGPSGDGAALLGNLRMLAGVVVAISALLLVALTGPAIVGRGSAAGAAVNWVPAGAAVVVLWGLSFEADRALAQLEAGGSPAWMAPWHPFHLRALCWTLLWGAGGAAMMLWSRVRFTASVLAGGGVLLALAAVAWLSFDTVGWRLAHGVVTAPVFLNLQFAVGAALAVLIAGCLPLWRGAGDTQFRGTALALLGLIGLWAGSLEIDRYFAPEAGHLAENAAMARQTALSIYWGVYALAAVAVGFARRAAVVRYAGLALLAVTLAKVLIVEMAEVRYVYRVLSFIGVGLLLVATSIGYARLAPRLLADAEPPDDAAGSGGAQPAAFREARDVSHRGGPRRAAEDRGRRHAH